MKNDEHKLNEFKLKLLIANYELNEIFHPEKSLKLSSKRILVDHTEHLSELLTTRLTSPQILRSAQINLFTEESSES